MREYDFEVVCESGAVEALAQLPEHLQEGIRDYIEVGLPLGGFLQAVVQNDLARAVERADPFTSLQLKEVVKFFLHYAPGTCHGSKQAYEEWIKGHEKKIYERNVSRVKAWGRDNGNLSTFLADVADTLQKVGVTVKQAERGFNALALGLSAVAEQVKRDPKLAEEVRAILAKVP